MLPLAALLALIAGGCVPPADDPRATPPAVTGLTAQSGGGSGEVEVSWTPLPPNVPVAHYRVYRERYQSIYIPMAVVKPDAYYWLAGRLGLVDAPDYWPWPSIDPGTGPRCYTVSAVSTAGLEGPMSTEVCGSPPGGPPG